MQADESQAAARACTIADFVAVFFVSILFAIIGSLVGAAYGGIGTLSETIGGLVGLWTAIVPSAFLLSRRRGTGNLAHDFALRFGAKDGVGIVVGLFCQIALLPAVYFLIDAVGPDLVERLSEPAEELTAQADAGAEFAVLAFLLIVGAPFVEELFYRGMLVVALAGRMPDAALVVVSGVVFGAAHFQPLLFPGLAAFGMVLAWLRLRYGRLGPCIVAHAVFNAITVAALA